MDDCKFRAIFDWGFPNLVSTLWSFLGFGFMVSQVHKTNILKKSLGYNWDEAHGKKVIETSKGILVKAFMLKLSNFDWHFEIHSNTSKFAIGGILIQNGRLVAFENNKLN